MNPDLRRVGTKIEPLIREFLDSLPASGEFRMQELLGFVLSRDPSIAPASPDRVLRDMRARGAVQVELVSRRGSLYRYTESRPDCAGNADGGKGGVAAPPEHTPGVTPDAGNPKPRREGAGGREQMEIWGAAE